MASRAHVLRRSGSAERVAKGACANTTARSTQTVPARAQEQRLPIAFPTAMSWRTATRATVGCAAKRVLSALTECSASWAGVWEPSASDDNACRVGPAERLPCCGVWYAFSFGETSGKGRGHRGNPGLPDASHRRLALRRHHGRTCNSGGTWRSRRLSGIDRGNRVGYSRSAEPARSSRIPWTRPTSSVWLAPICWRHVASWTSNMNCRFRSAKRRFTSMGHAG